MKAKKIISIALAAAMAAASAISASAAQLTESNPGGETEVIAHITGESPEPGEVSYIITIPDVVDFGELSQPANSESDSNKDVNFTVEATEINNLNAETQQISVYVKDQKATVEDSEFYIANKTDSNIKFNYDMYNNTSVFTSDKKVNGAVLKAAGYYLTSFTTTGETLEGTLRLNQVQLCAYDLADIVGDYSGYMSFFSAIEDQ